MAFVEPKVKTGRPRSSAPAMSIAMHPTKSKGQNVAVSLREGLAEKMGITEESEVRAMMLIGVQEDWGFARIKLVEEGGFQLKKRGHVWRFNQTLHHDSPLENMTTVSLPTVGVEFKAVPEKKVIDFVLPDGFYVETKPTEG